MKLLVKIEYEKKERKRSESNYKQTTSKLIKFIYLLDLWEYLVYEL